MTYLYIVCGSSCITSVD